MESKVEETLIDSSGSLRKTIVKPFCFEKTKITKADSLISDKVIDRGIVSPAAAASGCGDVKEGFADRYVFKGFACIVDALAHVVAHELWSCIVGLEKARIPVRPISKFHAEIHPTQQARRKNMTGLRAKSRHPRKSAGKEMKQKRVC